MNHYITFANNVFKNQAKRIAKEAIDTEWFNSVTIESPETIEEFYTEHKNFFETHPVGVGHFLWKPYIILRKLEQLKDGEFLFYTDAGSSILPHREYRFNEYIELLKSTENSVLVFAVIGYLEKMFQKIDVLEYFSTNERNLKEDKEFLDSLHIEGGIFICRKNNYSVNFVKKWLDALIVNNYKLLVDVEEHEKEKQVEGFSGHRHDQSVLSVLAKVENAQILIYEEAYGMGPFFSGRMTDNGPRNHPFPAPDRFRTRPGYDCFKHFTIKEWLKDFPEETEEWKKIYNI